MDGLSTDTVTHHIVLLQDL